MAARSRKKPASQALELIESWREGIDQVDTLAKQTARALEQGQLARARESFADYRELVLTHLAHEEDVSFPAAEERAPSQGGPIKSLRVAHIGIRRDLEQVATHLELGHVEAAGAVFAAFLESFAAHERLEDQLIELLRKSRRGTGPSRRSG
jgi:iron-sulfur cluster repair protein YtfE (RIC family)